MIENGPEFFNRSLYGGNTAFRVDGGDQPEFMLYLPGRGGHLGGRWVTLRGILLQTFQANGLQVAGHLPVQPGWWHRILGDYLIERFHPGLCPERRPTG